MTYQVGGDHYKGSFQHWDWVAAIGLDYFASTATKYICRWRDKGGFEDLEKALTYVLKLQEIANTNRFHRLEASRSPLDYVHSATIRVAKNYNMTLDELSLLVALATWKSPLDVQNAVNLLVAYMAANAPPASPVPLTEENHNGQREGQPDEDYQDKDEAKVYRASKEGRHLQEGGVGGVAAGDGKANAGIS